MSEIACGAFDLFFHFQTNTLQNFVGGLYISHSFYILLVLKLFLQTSDMAYHEAIVCSASSRSIITTDYLVKSLTNGMPLFLDTTYKLLQKAVSVFGTSDTEGHFVPVGIAVTEGDGISEYEYIFNSIKRYNPHWKPQPLFCNETPYVREAALNIFGTTLFFAQNYFLIDLLKSVYLGDEIIICTSLSYVKMCVRNEFPKYNIVKNDRKEILADLDGIGASWPHHQSFSENIQGFLLK